jgi:hypothetical protein
MSFNLSHICLPSAKATLVSIASVARRVCSLSFFGENPLGEVRRSYLRYDAERLYAHYWQHDKS